MCAHESFMNNFPQFFFKTRLEMISSQYLIIFFLCINLTCSDYFDNEWDIFKTKFNKQYENSLVESKRLNIFKKNLKFIKSHNENEKKTFKVEVNRFSDLEENDFVVSEDFKRSSWGHFKDFFFSKIITSQVPYYNDTLTISDEVDWRGRMESFNVKDQILTNKCNAGYAFAAVGTLEAHYLIKTGQHLDLSEQEVIDCSELNLGCAGGNDEFTFNYLIKNGIALEHDYEYKSSKGKCPKEKMPRSAVKVYGYASVKGEENLKKAMDQFGPISVRVKVPRQSFQFYKEGILNDLPCGNVEKTFKVILYGFDYDNKTNSNYWIVKNSWSESWGEGGFMRIKINENSCIVVKKGYYPLLEASASDNNQTLDISEFGLAVVIMIAVAVLFTCCCCFICVYFVRKCIDNW